MLVQQLTHVPAADDQAMREGPRDSATHLAERGNGGYMTQIEIGGTGPLASAGESL